MPNKVLQEWECLVEEIAEDSVWLRLYDITNDNDGYIEQAEVPIEGLGEAGKDLKEGTILYWTIEETDKKEILSIFKRRNIYWTQEEIEKAKVDAEILWKKLNGLWK